MRAEKEIKNETCHLVVPESVVKVPVELILPTEPLRHLLRFLENGKKGSKRE